MERDRKEGARDAGEHFPRLQRGEPVCPGRACQARGPLGAAHCVRAARASSESGGRPGRAFVGRGLHVFAAAAARAGVGGHAGPGGLRGWVGVGGEGLWGAAVVRVRRSLANPKSDVEWLMYHAAQVANSRHPAAGHPDAMAVSVKPVLLRGGKGR